ncbi:lysozyme [Fibrella aquatilis]|uniref:Lysozyme n=1 Tax=Fibrella aquatilis TaxID=2817059 RepID=A0A939GDK3_9BACT|nr:lysozyme [Fibrella aquatilis]MBO0934607.1 lysozyme [Fibrella aquatilis]
MKISKKGLDLIKYFEQLRLTAYYCPANVLTIGYGHTGHDVHEGLTITQEHATDLLLDDVARFETCVNHTISKPLTQNQFDALVSLAYNIGETAFSRSTLAKEINQDPTSKAVRQQYMLWVKAKGRVLPGLVVRRSKELALYFA